MANNQLEGLVDFEQLSSENGSVLNFIDVSNNNFETQTISWESFEFVPYLEHLDVSHNLFVGTVELSYFQYCKNLKYFNVGYNLFTSFDDFDESITETYMPELEDFIISNNDIDEAFDMTIFTRSKNLKTLQCNNNSLINSKIDMSDIPSNLEIFICGNNDFGEFIWDPSPYDDYNLKYIDLTNARIYGHITMKFFDVDDGGYEHLEYVDFSSNDNLNVSVNFINLDAQTHLYYLNLYGTDAYGSVDFDYLSDSIADNITIRLDIEIYCVDSYCSGNSNGKNYGYKRNNNSCYSKQGCLDTCSCETAYTLGLEEFIPSEAGQISFAVLVVAVCALSALVVFGKVHAIGIVSIGLRSDYFAFMGFIAFIFQIWDFFSDLLLCFDIFDHYNQASTNNPERDDYFGYLISCTAFIFVPWIVNLIFLIKTKREWEKESNHYASRTNVIDRQKIDALGKSSLVTRKWLNKYSALLVVLCMISGGLTASLKVVNSNLFGLKQFNMGLPQYKQDENARHRLWLTIVLENVPQIFISTLYARNLAGFDTTVLAALLSSIASVVLAILSAYLEYPKKYFIYQMGIQLKSSQNLQLRKSLRMRETLANVICESTEREKGFLFIENVYYNGKDFVCFNVVSAEPMTIDFRKKRKMMKLLFENKALRISCEKVHFTFVDFKSVELSFCFEWGKASTSAKNKPEIELTMSGSQGRIKSVSATPSAHDRIGLETGVGEMTGFNAVNKVEWHLWSSAQVNAWAEMELRRGIADLGISDIVGENNDDEKKFDDIEFVDEDQEMLADQFMKKFKSLSLSGQLLLKMKKNQELKNTIKGVMSDPSVGFWFIVSMAIDSLELPNDDNDNNGVNDMDQINAGVVDGNVDEETAKLLS